MKMRFAIACLVLAGFAGAQEPAPERLEPPRPEVETSSAEQASNANRKAYDALYSDILKALPQEGKSKVDSARGRAGSSRGASAEVPPSVEGRKEALEKRKRDLDELSPEVKARVDKALKELENRRMEKKAEFLELK